MPGVARSSPTHDKSLFLHTFDSADLQMYFGKSLFSFKQENIAAIDKIINFTSGSYMILYRNGQRVFKIPGSTKHQTHIKITVEYFFFRILIG